MRLPKAHQVVLGIGDCDVRLRDRERHHARDHGLARPLADPTRGLRQRPHRDEGRVLRRRSPRCCSSSRGWRRYASRTGSAASPTTGARPARTSRSGAKSYRSGVWMQTLLRDPAAGLMHAFLYFGFVSLFIVTVISEADHQLPDRFKFLHGQTYQAYSVGRRDRRAHVPRSGSCGPSPAATCSGRTASGSRPGPKTL